MNKSRKLTNGIVRALGLVLAFLIAFSGAGLSFMNNEAAIRSEAASAKISKKKKTIRVGQTFKLKIKNSKKDYVWKSSNSEVAMVLVGAGQSAQIGGMKPGKATITATNGNKVFKCKVTVKAQSKDNDNSGKDPGKDDNSGKDDKSDNGKNNDNTGDNSGKDNKSQNDDKKQETVSVPTLDDELNSDTYGLLYPQKKIDYIPKTYYDISTADDLLKAMINGVQTCTRGIGVRYDNQNFSYWKSLYMDYINRSEMCNSTNVFYADSEDTGVMAISPIYKFGWKALTYYKFIRPGMDEDLRDYISIDDITMKSLKMAHEIAEDAIKAHSGDEKAILQYVNDRICDLTTYSKPVPAEKDAPARDVIGVFINHDAVCEGYTAAMQLVLNILGFENHTVKNKRDNHIWNRVKVNGTWYHIDATWNDRKRSDGSYANEWFMLTDAEITKKNGSSDAHAWIEPQFMD